MTGTRQSLLVSKILPPLVEFRGGGADAEGFVLDVLAVREDKMELSDERRLATDEMLLAPDDSLDEATRMEVGTAGGEVVEIDSVVLEDLAGAEVGVVPVLETMLPVAVGGT